MNDYKVCSFESNGTRAYLVLDVVVDVEKQQAQLQGFKSDGSCLPFPLSFTVKFSAEELLNEAFLDGINYVKEIEGWQGEGRKETLDSISSNVFLMGFIKEHCNSDKLTKDIDLLLRGNA